LNGSAFAGTPVAVFVNAGVGELDGELKPGSRELGGELGLGSGELGAGVLSAMPASAQSP